MPCINRSWATGWTSITLFPSRMAPPVFLLLAPALPPERLSRQTCWHGWSDYLTSTASSAQLLQVCSALPTTSLPCLLCLLQALLLAVGFG